MLRKPRVGRKLENGLRTAWGESLTYYEVTCKNQGYWMSDARCREIPPVNNSVSLFKPSYYLTLMDSFFPTEMRMKHRDILQVRQQTIKLQTLLFHQDANIKTFILIQLSVSLLHCCPFPLVIRRIQVKILQ